MRNKWNGQTKKDKIQKENPNIHRQIQPFLSKRTLRPCHSLKELDKNWNDKQFAIFFYNFNKMHIYNSFTYALAQMHLYHEFKKGDVI